MHKESAFLAAAQKRFQRQAYSFEKDTLREPGNAQEHLHKLKHNLGMEECNSNFDSALLEFITHYHLNIAWYICRLDKEQKKRRGFFWLSVGLLTAIPIITIAITFKWQGETELVLTAILTGLIGAYNAFRELLEKRNLMGIFHQAASKLKTNLYDFEQEWYGKVPLPNASKQSIEIFELSLADAVRKARKIEREEKDQYFQKISDFPSINLGDALIAAGSAAASIVELHRWKPPSNEQSKQATDKVNALRNTIAELEELIKKEKDPKQKKILVRQLKKFRADLRVEEKNLIDTLDLDYE